MSTTEVLVFPRDIFGEVFSLLPWDSIQTHIEEIESSFQWIPRPDAEVSDYWVQAIPCVFVRDNDDRYCIFRRVANEREDLSKRLSLIVGGHIDYASDGDRFEVAMSCSLIREINEEIGIHPEQAPSPVGVIIDGSSISASRHVAFLYEMTAEQVSPKAPEEFTTRSKFTGQFVSASLLRDRRNEFDPWSRLVIEEYVCSGGVQPTSRQSSFL